MRYLKVALITTLLLNSALLASSGFLQAAKPRAVTSGPKEHLFASYYAINSWSADNRYILVLQTDLKRGLPTVDTPAVLGLVDLEDDNKFIPLTETRCWNFQEATMAHWLAIDPNNSFIYNDLVDGKFVAIIYNIKKREKRIIPWPISAVSPDGKKALSINYARLRLTRPDYGYDGKGQDARKTISWPEDDGLFLVDLESGKAELILSTAAGRSQMPTIKEGKELAYYCHTKFNRNGTKVFWLARSVNPETAKGWQTTSFTCNVDGSDLQRCFPDGWGGSHFNWLDKDQLMVTAKYKDAFYTHVLFTIGQQDYTVLGNGLIDFDGHGVFSDDGKWMSTDTYPNKLSERKLILLRMSDQAIISLGTYFVPEIYKETYSRCDLHARWRPDTRMIGFNSVHEGTRQVYLIDIE